MSGEKISGDEVELESLAEEAEPEDQSDLGEGGEPKEEEVVGHNKEAIDLINPQPKKPRDLLAKSNKILRLEVQRRMKKFILFPEHMTTYGLWVGPEAEEEGIILFQNNIMLSHFLVDNTNKALNDSLDTNKKLKVKYQKAKQDKITAEAREKCLSKLNRSEKQLQTVQKEKAALTANHEEQTQELEKRPEAIEREIQELKHDYENQLIIGFELMNEAFKVVESQFVIERLDEVNLESLYLVVMAKVLGATLSDTTPEAQLREYIMHHEGDAGASLPATTSIEGEVVYAEASANTLDIEEEKEPEGFA
ncbi:hypothetical protein FNV43_RR19563 [Rhamnella rubrinervis]|uniref:Uncharacterized protein n=1 Tax=Rhamnella rubrinervis TaxID=2594499 RepID=A0A8K0GWD0_9ROSA|nr:hypothetical protein FNV43_RR19563 [Rhamnella rubrinervis]